jgi:hypothetical protein
MVLDFCNVVLSLQQHENTSKSPLCRIFVCRQKHENTTSTTLWYFTCRNYVYFRFMAQRVKIQKCHYLSILVTSLSAPWSESGDCRIFVFSPGAPRNKNTTSQQNNHNTYVTALFHVTIKVSFYYMLVAIEISFSSAHRFAR